MTQTIEQLTARVRELEEENTRLKREKVDFAYGFEFFRNETKRHESELSKQLAAAQAYAEQLREALETLNKVSDIGCDRVEKALALPRDTSALDAYVANQREAAYQEARRAAAQFEAELARQRDLAVNALESCGVNDGMNGPTQYYDETLVEIALSTIKESEGK